MVFLQRLQPGSQLLHGVLALAQGQLRSEHVAENEHGQQGSSRAAVVRCFLLHDFRVGWSTAAAPVHTALTDRFDAWFGTAFAPPLN